MEADIESRLISQFDGNWELQHGPLDEALFQRLPESNWTLLVQSLDYFHPPLQALIQACNFIPRWRLDDVMVSFATDNGGVGPHFDQYDVFLIQGAGKRRWLVGSKNQTISKSQFHSEILQIEPFATDLDIEVEAGDLLYIPSNTPHWGESIDNSICYSVGFRAPNIEAISQQLLEEASDEFNQLWQDQDLLNKQHNHGELPTEISQWAQTEIQQLTFSQKLKIAIGKEVTRLKYPDILPEIVPCEAEELSELAFIKSIKLNPLSRMAFYQDADKILLFINGEFIESDTSNLNLVKALNSYELVQTQSIVTNKETARKLIAELAAISAIEFES